MSIDTTEDKSIIEFTTDMARIANPTLEKIEPKEAKINFHSVIVLGELSGYIAMLGRMNLKKNSENRNIVLIQAWAAMKKLIKKYGFTQEDIDLAFKWERCNPIFKKNLLAEILEIGARYEKERQNNPPGDNT